MSDRTCAVEGCERPSRKRGWCQMHYGRWSKTGTVGQAAPLRIHGDNVVRFWSKVDQSGSCWLWRGYISPKGYGYIRWNGKMRSAHQVVLELSGRNRPDGHEVDHLCRVRNCVRPDHLEWVTHTENIRRSEPWLFGGKRGEHMRSRTHCKNGHEFTPENTRRELKGGGTRRLCLTCQTEVNRRSYEKKLEARRRG